MAITKKYKVTFDITHVIDSEMEAQLDERVLETARYLSGKTDRNPWGKSREFAQEFMVQALTYGKEGAAAFITKCGIREFIRSELKEDGFKISPAFVREVK